MRLLVLALVPIAVHSGAAWAGPQATGSFSISEPREPRAPRLNFRLVQDPDFDPAPVHHSGMIARTQVMPNGTLGIGLLKATPKKLGSGDWRPENGAPRSRKAAVSFQLKF